MVRFHYTYTLNLCEPYKIPCKIKKLILSECKIINKDYT